MQLNLSLSHLQKEIKHYLLHRSQPGLSRALAYGAKYMVVDVITIIVVK